MRARTVLLSIQVPPDSVNQEGSLTASNKYLSQHHCLWLPFAESGGVIDALFRFTGFAFIAAAQAVRALRIFVFEYLGALFTAAHTFHKHHLSPYRFSALLTVAGDTLYSAASLRYVKPSSFCAGLFLLLFLD